MACDVLKCTVLKRGNNPGCVHHFFIDEHLVGMCIKPECGEERQWPCFYEDFWDTATAMKYAMREVLV